MKKHFKIFPIILSAIFILSSFIAQAKIVECGKINKQRPGGTWYVITYLWQISDDGSDYKWTTWTEADMPGKEFGNAGWFYPPYKPSEKINNNASNMPREQLLVTPLPVEMLYSLQGNTDLLERIQPQYKTEVKTNNGILGVRIFVEEDDSLMLEIPVMISLYEVETGKMIFENEPLKIGEHIKYFDLSNQVNDKSSYVISFKAAGEVDSRTVFYFDKNGMESQRKMD